MYYIIYFKAKTFQIFIISMWTQWDLWYWSWECKYTGNDSTEVLLSEGFTAGLLHNLQITVIEGLP